MIIGRGRTSSAGTEEIARRSGGDSMRVDDAAALEQTLTRLRQRYALHFTLADAGNNPGNRDIQVQLSDAARRRYPGSEVRYRRANLASDAPASDDPVIVEETEGDQEAAMAASAASAPTAEDAKNDLDLPAFMRRERRS